MNRSVVFLTIVFGSIVGGICLGLGLSCGLSFIESLLLGVGLGVAQSLGGFLYIWFRFIRVGRKSANANRQEDG
jgi:hypothetical protein